ncbi:MAG TPA: hypothetical protein VEA80_10435 [Vitreimonas sp.]|uniref:hypothetical protein n=1 Tax=Vitreimonas sp. TaxID=3069702 RepID=UPI002D45C572|nr:hypothetical protein [Vitreimonas sp.]HYD87883.1 hypothetical protein [Vitreimonas sp.]
MREAAGAVILATVLTASALPALACSCVRFSNAREQVRTTDVLFIGRAVRTERDWFNRHLIYTTFVVDESLKGDVRGHVRVAQSDHTTCAVQTFARGARVIVLADRGRRGLHIGPCVFPYFTEAEYRAALRPS